MKAREKRITVEPCGSDMSELFPVHCLSTIINFVNFSESFTLFSLHPSESVTTIKHSPVNMCD
jgi:hypothetical protein